MANKQANGNQSSRFNQSSNAGKKKVKYQSSSYSNQENYFLLVIAFVLAVIPLIIHSKVYEPNLAQFDWFSATLESIDVFLYYKQLWFVIAFVVMLLCFAGSFFNGKRKFKFEVILIPAFVYAGLSLLSTLFSKYSSFGYSGIFEQFENVFCLLGYVAIVYFVYLYVNNENEVRILLNVLAVGALIIGVIGTFQGMKLDFFRGALGKSIIASARVPADSLSFSFDEGRAYVTLYNPNYVGVYCTLLIPVFTVLIPYAKSLVERILYSCVVLTLLVSMFAAQFKAGIISLAATGVVILILLRKQVLKKWFIILPVIVAVVGLFIGVDTVNGHNYSTSIKNALTITKSPGYALNAIDTQENGITFSYYGQKYTFTMNASDETGTLVYSDFVLTKEDGTQVPLTWSEDGAVMYFGDANLATFYMTMSSADFLYTQDGQAYQETYPAISLVIDGKEWKFAKKDGVFKYYNYYGRAADIETAETALFDGYEELASKRGFIWARTIPLLKKYLFLGSGADTFSIVFPQHDYVAAYNNGYGDQLISKPHCMYLQVGVQTGVVSLIAMLVFFGMYIVQSFCLYGKKIGDSLLDKFGVAILVGTVGYMVSSISNDSSVTVAPVFWCLMGLGIAVNTMVKKQREYEKQQ